MLSHWMVVGTARNLEITAGLGWTVQGFKSRHRKKAESMRPGDMLVYYVTGTMAFAAVARVTSQYFESRELVWHSEAKPADIYPWRVHIAPETVLSPSQYIPAKTLIDRLTFVQKWPSLNWTLAFQGNVHLLPPEDGLLLVGLIRAAAG